MNVLEGWEPRKLIELAEYINGYAFKPEDWGEEGLPIIRIEQLKNPTSPTDYYSGRLPAEQIINDGDLLFSWSASLFLKIWNNGQAALNQHLFKVIERQTVDRLFLKEFIEFYLPELTKASHGSTMQHITRKELDKFSALFPISKTEQTKIAEILSTVDLAIEQTEALIAKQKRIKAGLMQDLLTRGIDEQGNLRSEETHQFRDSSLGRIPFEWNLKLMDQLLIKKQYGISSGLSDEPIGVPVLRMNNLVEGEVDYSDLKYSAGSDALKVLLEDGDVLFNRTNSIDYVGRTGIYRDKGFQVSFASYLVRLITDNKKLRADYLNLWLNDEANRIRVKRFATMGVQQANINPTNLGTIEIAYPNKVDEQDRICGVIESSCINLRVLNTQLQKIKLLKTGLMQDLLTGKRRVTALLSRSEEASA